MSWDLYFIKFREGVNASFDPESVRAVFSKHCVNPLQPPLDPFLCKLADGSQLEVWADGLDGATPIHGPTISLRGYTEAAAEFPYDLAVAGDMTIVNTGDPVVLLTHPKQRDQLPPDLRDGQRESTVTVNSAASLNAALAGGYKAWRAYRDRVVNTSHGKKPSDEH